ncbi:hypothetical protein EIK56_02935 [Sphingomonas sp. C8-2]|nr:hypothetical protein EIK56_02935 [Sphingomonas sp. C8-2]
MRRSRGRFVSEPPDLLIRHPSEGWGPCLSSARWHLRRRQTWMPAFSLWLKFIPRACLAGSRGAGMT